MSLALDIVSGGEKDGSQVSEWTKKVHRDGPGDVWTNACGGPFPPSIIPQGSERVAESPQQVYGSSPTPFTLTIEDWGAGKSPMHYEEGHQHPSQGPGSSVAGFNGSEDTGDDPDNGDLRGGSAMFLHDDHDSDPMDIDSHPTNGGPAGTSWPANQPIATPSSRDEGPSNPRGRRLPPVGRRGRNLRPGDSTTPFSSLGPPSSRQETAVPPPGGTSFVTDKDILQRATKYWNSGGSTSRSGGQ
jgi:hypothetical protein